MSASEERVTVVGGGYMGGGIAQTFAANGFPTTLVDDSPERSRQRVTQLHEEASRFAADQVLSEQAAAAIIENLRPAESLESALIGASYVTEAVPERVDLKRQILGRISALVSREVVIGSNTSITSRPNSAGQFAS